MATLLAASACGPISGGSDAGDAAQDGPVDAPADAPASDASVDAGTDVTLDAAADAAPDATVDAAVDATLDASTDAPADAVSDAPFDADASVDATPDAPSAVYDDGIRDLSEECDDGVVSPLLDSCSSLCEVRDLVAVSAVTDASLPSRTLGLGRHPIAAGTGGFAVAWVEPALPTVGMTFYGPKGVPTGNVDRFGVGTTNLTTSSPVLAALPGGKYAVAWTDLALTGDAGDGDAEGVALRIVDPSVSSSGAPSHANTTTVFSQYEPDILWTGTELVVAWADTSNAQTGPDLRLRTFDATLTPTSAEQTLAGSSAAEEGVALTTFAGSWAAAWREAQNGFETIRASAANVAFSVGPFAPGPYGDPPALVELDPTHLLVVFAEGSGQNTAKLRGAVLDTAQPGTTVAFDLGPLVQGDAGTPLGIMRPAAVRAGTRVFVAWATEAAIADPRGEEMWLKEVTWNGSTLATSSVEIPLPRWDAHRLGDQRFPALAGTALGPEGAIAAAWMDLGKTFSAEANGDVAVELVPVPVVRKLSADGGGL